MSKLNCKDYASPELRTTSLECCVGMLYSSVIKITAIDGVTVAPWDDVVPNGTEPIPGADHSFDVTFE